MAAGDTHGDDTYPLQFERRSAQKTWTLQTITAAISIAATIIAGGWSVASLVQARLNNLHDMMNAQEQEVILVRERILNLTSRLDQFQGAGARFTAGDGKEMATRIERVENRVGSLEQRVAVQEDRGQRGGK